MVKGPGSLRGLGSSKGYIRPAMELYFPPLFLPALLSVPGPTLPWPDGLRASPLFMPPILLPVVMPDFILDFDLEVDLVAPGPTLPSLEAPGAGCICADAISTAPNSD